MQSNTHCPRHLGSILASIIWQKLGLVHWFLHWAWITNLSFRQKVFCLFIFTFPTEAQSTALDLFCVKQGRHPGLARLPCLEAQHCSSCGQYSTSLASHRILTVSLWSVRTIRYTIKMRCKCHHWNTNRTTDMGMFLKWRNLSCSEKTEARSQKTLESGLKVTCQPIQPSQGETHRKYNQRTLTVTDSHHELIPHLC